MSHETIMVMVAALSGFVFSLREYLIAFTLGRFFMLKVIYLGYNND